MKHSTLLILLTTLFYQQLAYSAPARDFCFRAYSSGITNLSIDNSSGNEVAQFSDSHILQSSLFADVITLSNGQKTFQALTDNTMGYAVGGLTIRFDYEDLQNELKGEYAVMVGNTPVAGGPFHAYEKSSSQCSRPTAPANLGNNRPFVSTVVVSPSKIKEVSRFNSGYGHSYTVDTSCRNQKHHYMAVIHDDSSIKLRLPNTANGTTWKVWSWIWEDDVFDRSIVYQNQDWPWLFIKVHHIFTGSPPLLNQIIAGDDIIGTARYGTGNQSAFSLSIEYLDHNNQLKMTSIFNLYDDSTIENAYAEFTQASGIVDRSIIIQPNNYHWQEVEKIDYTLSEPDLSNLPRTQRCIGHNPSATASIFPDALADDFVISVSDLANVAAPVAGTTGNTCSDFNILDVDEVNPTGVCRIEEHRDSVFSAVH